MSDRHNINELEWLRVEADQLRGINRLMLDLYHKQGDLLEQARTSLQERTEQRDRARDVACHLEGELANRYGTDVPQAAVEIAGMNEPFVIQVEPGRETTSPLPFPRALDRGAWAPGDTAA